MMANSMGPVPFSITSGKCDTLTIKLIRLFVVNLISSEAIIKLVIIKSSFFEESILMPIGSSMTLYSSKLRKLL